MDRSKRDFLRMVGTGAAAASLPGLIGRALAIPANRRTRSIEDVEHIVVFMQENRAFDHYFGMFSGVRGFGDPRPLRLKGGASVWRQPSREHPDGYVMPYHGDSKVSRAFLVDGADQSHQGNMTIFNEGRYDRWGASGELHNRMLHYTAGDLPFYYALADAFTVCDAYHCSTMTQTYPNRLHLFTGCNGGGTFGGDPQMHNYGEDETPSADMREDKPLRPDAYRWTTYAERLEKAGVSWKVYQEYDNFGDNLLSVFPAFRPCAPESPLYRRGRSWVSEHKAGADRTRSDGEQLVAAFRDDLANGTLPQISWIVTAAALSEHPAAEPSRGEHVAAELIAALVDHPETFAKTAFIINYDEAGGFYDHIAPPVPPVAGYRGHSTVPIGGETKDWRQGAVANTGTHPIGLGIRVPAIIVSPWTRGGYVCSELFDHTSVLQFMEKRFGVAEPNISAWRRAVCGDLTSAFDFAGADVAAPDLPQTRDFLDRIARSKAGTALTIAGVQTPPRQMPGQRPARRLAYALDINAALSNGRLGIDMANTGRTGAVFSVHDNHERQAPWHFTIGAGARHAANDWHRVGDTAYDLTVHGPDGFYRRFAGTLDATTEAALKQHATAVDLTLANHGSEARVFVIALDPAYPGPERTRRITVSPGKRVTDRWHLAASDAWYDLSVRREGDATFLRRFAGRLSGSRKTDPGIGAMRLDA